MLQYYYFNRVYQGMKNAFPCLLKPADYSDIDAEGEHSGNIAL